MEPQPFLRKFRRRRGREDPSSRAVHKHLAPATELYHVLRDVRLPELELWSSPSEDPDSGAERAALLDCDSGRLRSGRLVELWGAGPTGGGSWLSIQAPRTEWGVRAAAALLHHPQRDEAAGLVGAGAAGDREAVRGGGGVLLLALLEPLGGEDELAAEALLLLAQPPLLLLFHTQPLQCQRAIHEVAARIPPPLPPPALLYLLVRHISRTLLLVARGLAAEVRDLSELVLEGGLGAREELDFLRKIALVRAALLTARLRAARQRGLCQRASALLLASSVQPTVRDVAALLAEVARAHQRSCTILEHAADIAAALPAAYLGRVSLEMAARASRGSGRSEKMAAVTIVLFPLMLLQGVFSVNVNLPGRASKVDNLHWFFGLLASFIAVVVVLWIVFWRLGWWR